MTGTPNEIVCQCTKCNHVYNYDEKVQVNNSGVDSYRCPKCKGRHRIISFSNKRDEDYINRLAERVEQNDER